MNGYILIKIGDKYYKELSDNNFELTENKNEATKISDKLNLWDSANGYSGYIHYVLKEKYPDHEIRTLHYLRNSSDEFIEVEDLKRIW